MATKISKATGNFTAATTWANVDAGSEIDSEYGYSGSSTSTMYTPNFALGANTLDGVAIKIAVINATTGTVTVILSNYTAPGLREGTTTINVADLRGPVAALAGQVGWYFFKFPSNVTPNGTDLYRVGITTSVNNSLQIYTSQSNGYSRMVRLTSAGVAPAANDKLMLMGECTGPGTQNSFTVTMDNTTTTVFGPTVSGGPPQTFTINAYSTLSYGTAASTNYYLRTQGVFAVWAGGTLSIGTSGTPIPSTSTAVLEFNCVSNVDSGLEIRSGAFNAFGFPKWPGNTISNATNTTPIQIYSSGHGLVVGERITIKGVAGNTAANGTWEVISVVDANNFKIGAINGAYPGPGAGTSTGNGLFTSGGGWTRLAYSKMNVPRGGMCMATNGSSSIIGVEGQSFIGLSGSFNIMGTTYTIASVTDATHLTLTANYVGTTYNTMNNYAMWIHPGTAATVNVVSTAGWSPGDRLAFATTTKNPVHCEMATIQSVDSATQVTLTTALQNYHGGTAPVQIEVGNITRNAVIRGISTSLQGYVLFGNTATVTCNHAEFAQHGSGSTNKRGIDCATITGSCSLTYCAIHDFTLANSQGFNISGSTSNNIVYTNNVTWLVAGYHFSVAITSGTWLADANLFVRQTDSVGIMQLGDIGGTVTNNTLAGSPGSGYYATENNATAPTWSGNTAHGCTSHGFYCTTNCYPAILNTFSWRHGNSGIYCVTIRDTVFTGVVAFGNVYNINIQGCMYVTFINLQTNGDISFANGYGIQPYQNSALTGYIRIDGGRFGISGFSGFLTTNNNGDIYFPLTVSGDVTFRNCLFATGIPNPGSGQGMGMIVCAENYNQVVGDNRWWGFAGATRIDTTIYKSRPPSVRMTPGVSGSKTVSNLGYRTGFMVLADSGASRTVSVSVRASTQGDGGGYNGNPPRLLLKRNVTLGVAADTVLATGSAVTGQWYTLSGTTPAATASGVWEFFVDCDGIIGWINLGDWNAV